jgi:beta-barrel assembly-enhancing protease
LKGMVRAAGIVTLVSIMTGDVSAVGAAAAQLSALSFQREDEEEADREGMRAMQRARLDPEGMVRIYQRLALESGDLPVALRYLSTHPEMKERVERLKQLAAENRYQPAAVDNAVNWAEVRALCR